MAQAQGEYDRARAWFQAALKLAHALRNRLITVYTLENLGQVALLQHEVEHALPLLHTSLTIFKDLGVERGVAWSLEALAEAAIADGDGQRAARLLGAAESLRAAARVPLQRIDRAMSDLANAAVQEILTEEQLAQARDEGRAMTVEQAVAYVLGGE